MKNIALLAINKVEEFELDDEEAPKAPEYVSINNIQETAEKVAEKAEDLAEKVADAAEGAVDAVKDAFTE